MYTEAEIRFLLEARTVETRGGKMKFKELADFRKLGGRNVEPVFKRMLDRRALALERTGNIFTEFRKAKHASETRTTNPDVESVKLF